MTRTKYHMCLSVRGFLKNATKSKYKNMFKDENGKTLSPEAAKDYLFDQLSQGRNVIPFGECDNFDYKDKGCMGHPYQEEIK